MYLPAQFKQSDEALTRLAMRESPFATLVSVIPGLAEPFISQLPIVVPEREDDASSNMMLLGHLAKPNPHSKVLHLPGSHQLLFTGPNAYMSPSVYEDKNKVPTWTYISVLAQGSITLVQGHDGLDKLLKALIAQHEPAYADQWRGIALDMQEKLLNGIVGFTFEVTRLESKFKLNQHRPESHRSMAAQLEANASQGSGKALALWMQRLGLV